MFAIRNAVQRWKFMDSSLSFYFEHIYIYIYMSNDTKSHKKLHFSFVPTELLIDGPEEYNQLGSAFISIYRRYDKVFY
jgi:hypothetical protein